MIHIKLERNIAGTTNYTDSRQQNTTTNYFGSVAHKYWNGIYDSNVTNYLEIELYNHSKDFFNDKQNQYTEQEMQVIKNTLNMREFKFKKGQFFNFGGMLLAGTKGIKSPEDWRQFGYDLFKYIRSHFPNLHYAVLNRQVGNHSKQFFEGIYLSDYRFTKYKSSSKSLRDLTLCVSPKLKGEDCTKERTAIFKMIKEAKHKVRAQFLSRDWVNTVPEDANSKTIGKDIVQHFKNHKNIDVKVYKEKDLKTLNMNGHLSVNRASKYPAKVVRITYTPDNFVQTEQNKIIVGVGKGLTYDSGGLSLKPSASMTTMKADKSGAMALYGLADVLGKEGGQNKVVLYLTFAENMVSKHSYRPDDVVTFKNGKTAHILNTDAEGRVVLFDSLCLAQDENPTLDEIFSIATLTGAAVFQFGDEAAGMVSKNEELFKPFYEKGKIEDEIFCEAKLHKFMMDGIKDDLADMANTGTPNQGCQKAGLFLMNAIKKKNIKKYLHLDVAGPSHIKKAFGTNPSGGTGFGVRTLFEVYR
jgi:leucyl aminopeptidase